MGEQGARAGGLRGRIMRGGALARTRKGADKGQRQDNARNGQGLAQGHAIGRGAGLCINAAKNGAKKARTAGALVRVCFFFSQKYFASKIKSHIAQAINAAATNTP